MTGREGGMEGRPSRVDPEKPTVYYYISHAFLKGKPILQVNYVDLVFRTGRR